MDRGNEKEEYTLAQFNALEDRIKELEAELSAINEEIAQSLQGIKIVNN